MKEVITLFLDKYGLVVIITCIVWFVVWHMLRGLWDGTDYLDKGERKEGAD